MSYESQSGFLNDLKGDFSKIEAEGKRRIRREKREAVESRTAQLVAEQERIARAIGFLYNSVYSNPDRTTPELLMDFVRSRGEEPFDEAVTKNFAVALDGYREKRAVVQKFLRENRDPVLMFQKCFGVMPKGKVEVVPGPMTVCFRCFDDDDYMAAWLCGEMYENNPEAKIQELEKASKSIGAAFYSVKEQVLSTGTVIAERVGKNFEDRPIFRKREVTIEGRNKNRWQKFDYPTSRDSNLIYFKIPVVGEVEAHLVRDPKGAIGAIWLVESASRTTIAEFDPFEKTEKIKISVPVEQYAAAEWVELEFASDSFALYDHTRSGAGFETVEYVRTDRLVKDKEESRQIRIHEEQHQFNKLFDPKEKSFFSSPFSEFKRLAQYAARHPGEDIVPLVADKFAQIYRQHYIDGDARDEIIAYIRGGCEPDNVARTLATGLSYNYKQELVSLENGSKATREKFIKDWVTYLTKTLLEKGSVTFTLGNTVYAVNFPVKKFFSQEQTSIARAEVDKMLGENYNKKLVRWTGLVKAMKGAGYENRDIVSFLNMFPINRWHSAVRRLLKSKGLRPIDKANLAAQ